MIFEWSSKIGPGVDCESLVNSVGPMQFSRRWDAAAKARAGPEMGFRDILMEEVKMRCHYQNVSPWYFDAQREEQELVLRTFHLESASTASVRALDVPLGTPGTATTAWPVGPVGPVSFPFPSDDFVSISSTTESQHCWHTQISSNNSCTFSKRPWQQRKRSEDKMRIDALVSEDYTLLTTV